MLWNVVGCAIIAVLGLWAAFMPGWPIQLRFIGGMLGVCLPFVSIALALRIRSGLAALKFDRHTLEIATFFRTASHRWSDVRSISRETLTQTSTFGFFKQELARYLVVTVSKGGGDLETYRIQEDLLDWPKDGLADLTARMVAFWEMPTAPAARARDVSRTATSIPPGINTVPGRINAPSGFGRRGL